MGWRWSRNRLEANDRAVVDGSHILSSYLVEGERVWVITESVNEQGVR
jgi:hypothetical protein